MFKTKSKRHFLLLEVLIAFVLVLMAVLPMIYPHVYILKSQYQFVETVELDHTVNLMYGEILQRLYQNRIPWNDIEEQKEFPINDILQAINYPKDFPFTGSYKFRIIKTKPPPPAARTLNLVELTFNFAPKRADLKRDKPLEYKYTLYMVRSLKAQDIL